MAVFKNYENLEWQASIAGETAESIPTGGSLGDVITKSSGTDYDTQWSVPVARGTSSLPFNTSGAYLSGSGLVLTGLAGNYAESPDSTALDTTDDIDIQVKVSFPDWTPSSEVTLVSKRGASGQRSYMFNVRTNGTLRLETAADGINSIAYNSSAHGISDGETKWVRVTRDSDNGAGGNDVKFYSSDDGVSWTQIGTTITGAGVSSIFNSTAPLQIGAQQGLSIPNATFYRVIILNGYDGAGSVVFDADFASAPLEALSFTESSANAATVSIITTRYYYSLPNHHWFGTTTLSNLANRIYYMPFNVMESIKISAVRFSVTTGPSSGANLRCGIYESGRNGQPVGPPLLDTQNISVAASTAGVGIYVKQVNETIIPPGSYLMAIISSQTMTLRAWRGGISQIVGIATTYTTSDLGTVSELSASMTFGAFPSTPVAWTDVGSSTIMNGLHKILLRYTSV